MQSIEGEDSLLFLVVREKLKPEPVDSVTYDAFIKTINKCW